MSRRGSPMVSSLVYLGIWPGKQAAAHFEMQAINFPEFNILKSLMST